MRSRFFEKALVTHSQEITSLCRTKAVLPCSQGHAPRQHLKPAGPNPRHHIYHISPKCLQWTPRWHTWVGCGGVVTPFESATITHWIRVWVGTRAVLDVSEKRNTSSPCRESNHDSSVVQAISYSLYRLPLLLGPILYYRHIYA